MGPTCAHVSFSVTPVSGKSLYNVSDPRNTWNGPIVHGPDGKLHMYVPLYAIGSLSKVEQTLHGLSDAIEGPWDWDTLPPLPIADINPAALTYNTAGVPSYTVWLGGSVLVAASPYGPFEEVANFTYPGVNPAPIFHNGAFFMTNQGTETIWTVPAIAPGAIWTVYANISHAALPPATEQYHVEDPYLWVDQRGYWHIVNHAYSNVQWEACGSSDVSAHFFSEDGLDWNFSRQPWGHTVTYTDGSSHTFTTLERPSPHFSTNGTLTHITLAADLVTGDEGCANRTDHAHNGHCPCDNCKWDDHAGTTVVFLGL